MKFFHFGKIESGKIKFDDYRSFQSLVKKLEGKEIELTLAKRKNRRSNNQNAYYFGVVVDILANEFGYRPEEFHEILKSMFLKVKVVVKGKEIEITKSTALLDTVEFENYLESIRIWASGEGIVIPLPNEVNLEAYADSLKPYL